MIVALIPADLVQRLAFCLAHSIWQASVVAVLTAGIARLMAKRTPELRYATFIIGLTLIPVLGVATFLSYDKTGPMVSRITGIVYSTPDWSAGFMQWTQWAVLFWLTGVAFCSVRLSASWFQSRRLLRLADESVPPGAATLFERTKEHLDISKPVRLLLSSFVEVPVVVGWLRPAVLLPVSAITGLAPDQLAAVLAHELAHIRRHDFAINVLQRCVESVMFYHPAVWWLSSRIRVERENCCDDLAVRVCGDRLIYVQALVALEQTRDGASLLALAATGGSLTKRIRRILGRETSNPEWLSAGAAGLFIVVWLLFGVWQSNALMAQPVVLPFVSVEMPVLPAVPAYPAPVTSSEISPSLAQIALMALSGKALQQQEPAIQGTVVKSGTGEPLPGTRVGLVTVDGKATAYTATAGADGTFRLLNVASGVYRLLAARSDGFLPAEYGQKTPNGPGTTITVNATQTIKDIQLAMLPPGAISGRILDQNGEPVGHARVQALKAIFIGSDRSLTIVQTVQTNDLGEYRLFWLAPGSYYVGASRQTPNTNRLQVYIQPPDYLGTHEESRPPLIIHKVQTNGDVLDFVEMPSYFPNVDDPRGASQVAVKPGDNIRGVDVRLAEPHPSRSVSGTVIDGVTGQPFSVRVQAMPLDRGPFRTGGPLSPTSTTYSTQADAKGHFEIAGLVSGSYSLVVSGPPPIPAERHGHISVEVADKDLQNLSITVPPSFPLNGKIIVDGSNNLDLTKIRVMVGNILTNISPNVPFPEADGTFTIRQLGPGDYDTYVGNTTTSYPLTGGHLPSSVYLKTVRFGNIDVLKDGLRLDSPPQAPLEIVIGTKPGTVSGTVRNARRDPVVHSVVALIPNGKVIYARTELYRITATNASGQFVLSGVRPGDYRLFAWEQVENGAWFDDEFIQSMQDRATTVHVDEGDKLTLEVTVIGARN